MEKYSIIQEISEKILKIYNDFYKTNIEYLDNLHYLFNNDNVDNDTKEYYKKIPIFGINDRKNKFIELFYNNYDSEESELKTKYLELMNNIKKEYFKNEEFIIIQKTPNFRIHFPNCSNIGKLDTDPREDIIGLHCDRMFGHPHEERNLIVALTDMYDTNSIFIEPNNENSLVDDYMPVKIKKNNISFHYLNKLKHYNKINKTNKTRVSFDIRVIPFSKYKDNENCSLTTNTKFSINNYYIKI